MINEDDFKAKLQKSYPYAYNLIQMSGKDMIGWIYRIMVNLLTKEEDKKPQI
jgi:hypothetical protein